mgnify:CR=1 FL=1
MMPSAGKVLNIFEFSDEQQLRPGTHLILTRTIYIDSVESDEGLEHGPSLLSVPVV